MQQKLLTFAIATSLLLVLTTACTDEKKDTNTKEEGTSTEDASQSPAVQSDPVGNTETDTTASSLPEAPSGTLSDATEPPPAGKDSRLAYINSAEILSQMPQVRQAEQELEEFAKGLDKELTRQQQLFQQKYTQYMQDTEASQAIVQTRSQEMQQMQERILKLQEDSERELARRKEKLHEPILNKVDRAIKKVAKDKGYTHVLDITGGSLVYAEETTNITPLVKAELGL